MAFRSINPTNGHVIQEFEAWSEEELETALCAVQTATPAWASRPMEERCARLRTVAEILRGRADKLARLITLEMGKLIHEARAEIEKCAWGCDYYAENGPRFLADEPVATDAPKSLVAYQPLGTVLAVMPWNFPFWQVFRFAAPALVAGNTAVLKHASNVQLCAQAIEDVFNDAGLPEGVFRNLRLRASQVAGVIADARIHAVTLTGSDVAGRQVAAAAGAHLKKTVMELGGSDAFVVLDDADVQAAVETAVSARFLNAGQSCIAAKRFIVTEPIAEEFVARFKTKVEALRPGDPMDEATTLAPLVRDEQRELLHRQVSDSIAAGAVAVTGCRILDRPGFYYAPSILDRVQPGMPAYGEELFGPVAAVIRATDAQDALRIANDSPFGLGGSIWTRDVGRGEHFARQMSCGCAFVNGMVKSDPRLPFGGIKHSGYGRELSHHGIREFCNIKSLWIR